MDNPERKNKREWNWRTGYFGSSKKSNGQNVNVNVKKTGGIFSTLILIGIVYYIIVHMGSSTSSNAFENKPTISQYNGTSVAQVLDYREALLEDYQTNARFKIVGTVEQKIDEDTMIVNISNRYVENIKGSNFKDSWTSTPIPKIYVDFESEPKILESDVVELSIRYAGVTSVRNLGGFGEKKDNPKFYADYYTVQNIN